MKTYAEDYEEIARMIVNKHNGDTDTIRNVYIKDGKVNVETEE